MFYGDGLMCPPDGYGEPIVERLVMSRPDAVFKSFHPGEDALMLEAALRGAPALIGKAPDLVLLGLGTADMLRGVPCAEALGNLRALIQLLLLKTQARVVVANVCGAFLASDARPAVAEFNAGLASLEGEQVAEPEGEHRGGRVSVLDLDGPVNRFLEAHRRGAGEKRSLHAGPLRLTSMGRVFLSGTAFDQLALEAFFDA